MAANFIDFDPGVVANDVFVPENFIQHHIAILDRVTVEDIKRLMTQSMNLSKALKRAKAAGAGGVRVVLVSSAQQPVAINVLKPADNTVIDVFAWTHRRLYFAVARQWCLIELPPTVVSRVNFLAEAAGISSINYPAEYKLYTTGLEYAFSREPLRVVSLCTWRYAQSDQLRIQKDLKSLVRQKYNGQTTIEYLRANHDEIRTKVIEYVDNFVVAGNAIRAREQDVIDYLTANILNFVVDANNQVVPQPLVPHLQRAAGIRRS